MKRLRTFAVLTTTLPLLITSAALATAVSTPLDGTGTVRVSGSDRYSTSAAISKKAFGPSQDVLFVASGENFPDALAGGTAAAKRRAPLLLTGNRVPSSIVAEVKRLRPAKIYILGGTGAVTGGAASTLSSIAPTQRIWGADRYSTAAAISRATFSKATTVYIASGSGFADALAGGPAAAKEDAPMLLTAPSSLPGTTKSELSRLKPSRVKVLGGTGAISNRVADQIRAAVPGVAVTRYSGADRYGTAASVARALWPTGSATTFYSSGNSFPDGLSATSVAAVNNAPLLLSTKACMPAATSSATTRLNAALRVFTGGTGAVTTGSTVCGSAKPAPPQPVNDPPQPSTDYDCDNFSTWASAQSMFDKYFRSYGDIFRLDRDGDGVACETLPGAP